MDQEARNGYMVALYNGQGVQFLALYKVANSKVTRLGIKSFFITAIPSAIKVTCTGTQDSTAIAVYLNGTQQITATVPVLIAGREMVWRE
jgi:hypothetical protein